MNECSREIFQLFPFHLQEVYSRDEGNSPDDHENDLFEKVTRQICNRIDELEDDMKRGGSMGNDTRRGGGGGGSGGDCGGGGGGGDGGLSNVVNHQTGQIVEVKQDITELKSLIMQMMKMPPTIAKTSSPQSPLHQDKNIRSSMTNLDPLYPQLPADGGYPPAQQPSYPQHPQQAQYAPPTNPYQQPPPIGLEPYNNRPQGPQGYLTDTEAYRNPDGGRGRRRRGKQKGGGYESDNNSYYSEAPVQQRPPQQPQQRRPRSPSSVASAPTGNKRNRRKKNKNIGGSWEDIRTEMNI